MDWVHRLHETPDLCGDIEVLDVRAIFIGHYSCIYKGQMRSTRELVAIKVLNTLRGTGLSTMRRKIERERRIWSSLCHRNILPLYGFADDHKLFTPFGAFISPWRRHGDLGEFLREEGEFTELHVRLRLWGEVVAGVCYLHSHEPLLVHGDLKPGNVLIDNDGTAQICDFGLVRVYLKEGHSGMTTASPHYGTQRYLAWELVMAAEDAVPTTASDIYAVGCIGLETLFLRNPYSNRGDNIYRYLLSDMQAGIPPATQPDDLEVSLGSLWELVAGCWAFDPWLRPSADALFLQLAESLEVSPPITETNFNEATDLPKTGIGGAAVSLNHDANTSMPVRSYTDLYEIIQTHFNDKGAAMKLEKDISGSPSTAVYSNISSASSFACAGIQKSWLSLPEPTSDLPDRPLTKICKIYPVGCGNPLKLCVAAHGFGRPTPHDCRLGLAMPVPDVIKLQRYEALPYFISGCSWNDLVEFITDQSTTIIDTVDRVLEDSSPPKLRAVLQFIKTARRNYCIVLYIGLQAMTPPPPDYPSHDTSSPPYMFPPPVPGWPLANAPMAPVYTILTEPFPVLPLSMSNLGLYLYTCVEDSHRYPDSRSRLAGLLEIVGDITDRPLSGGDHIDNASSIIPSPEILETQSGIRELAVARKQEKRGSILSRIFHRRAISSVKRVDYTMTPNSSSTGLGRKKGIRDSALDLVTPSLAQLTRDEVPSAAKPYGGTLSVWGHSRVLDQRANVDTRIMKISFLGNDAKSRIRRRLLDNIQEQEWLRTNRHEPLLDVRTTRDILRRGVGIPGSSIFTAFILEDKKRNQWQCLFGSTSQPCMRSQKSSESIEHAIAHIRAHLGHLPFACDGSCHTARSTGGVCEMRFLAASYLEGHKMRPGRSARYLNAPNKPSIALSHIYSVPPMGRRRHKQMSLDEHPSIKRHMFYSVDEEAQIREQIGRFHHLRPKARGVELEGAFGNEHSMSIPAPRGIQQRRIVHYTSNPPADAFVRKTPPVQDFFSALRPGTTRIQISGSSNCASDLPDQLLNDEDFGWDSLVIHDQPRGARSRPISHLPYPYHRFGDAEPSSDHGSFENMSISNVRQVSTPGRFGATTTIVNPTVNTRHSISTRARGSSLLGTTSALEPTRGYQTLRGCASARNHSARSHMNPHQTRTPKNACPLCHIMLKPQNMRRHIVSRHPNHLEIIGDRDGTLPSEEASEDSEGPKW